jgi:hypothetical protein
MMELEKGLFIGEDQQQVTDWALVFKCSLQKQPVEELFKTHGWEGEASSIVGL